jgi:hypothetical protein
MLKLIFIFVLSFSAMAADVGQEGNGQKDMHPVEKAKLCEHIKAQVEFEGEILVVIKGKAIKMDKEKVEEFCGK